MLTLHQWESNLGLGAKIWMAIKGVDFKWLVFSFSFSFLSSSIQETKGTEVLLLFCWGKNADVFISFHNRGFFRIKRFWFFGLNEWFWMWVLAGMMGSSCLCLPQVCILKINVQDCYMSLLRRQLLLSWIFFGYFVCFFILLISAVGCY